MYNYDLLCFCWFFFVFMFISFGSTMAEEGKKVLYQTSAVMLMLGEQYIIRIMLENKAT